MSLVVGARNQASAPFSLVGLSASAKYSMK